MQSRRALALTAAAIALASGAVGLALGALASGGQPLLLAALFALLGGSEYAVMVGLEQRRRREAADRQQLREDLVATVSHELRSPLAPIRGWASTLLENGDRLDDDARRQGLESIVRQSQRLERLVVNLLEASKIDSGVIDAADAEVDVAAVAGRVVDEFRAAWPARQIDLDCGDDAIVRGRDLWIEQILSNLLSNALKYAPPREPVEVRVRTAGDDVELEVTDHGPGIPSAETERVFDRFERLGRTDTASGSGLGLYIARRLAGEIGARLIVGPADGGGSRFVLSLPAASPVAVLS